MPSSKRSRPAQTHSDDEEEHEGRRESHKRARQTGRAIGRDDVVSSDDDVDISQTQYGRNRETYERERDEDDSDDEETRRMEDNATQDLMKQAENIVENAASDNGILEYLTCENFMCHKFLKIPLGPLINFIIGHNGSGKSAVLTGITICLGGKATATNRGQSLKGFVKQGEETATLTIGIKNQGEGSFKPDLYGKSIIIERHFNIHGTSGFKIRNANNKVVSTKRADLDEITDFYALQLDNPVNVLTQDNARQFLNQSTAADKYKFFMRGIQLEQLDQDYMLLADSLDSTDGYMETLEEDKTSKKKKWDQTAKKVKEAEQAEGITRKMTILSREMAWAQVEEVERKEVAEQSKLEAAEAKIAAEEQAFENASDEYARANDAFETAIAKKESLAAELVPLKEQSSQAQDLLAKKKEELDVLQNDQRTVKKELENEKQRAKKKQEEVDEERKVLEAADGGNQARMLQEIEQAEAELVEAQRRVAEQPSKDQLVRNRDTCEIKVRDAKAAVLRKRDELEHAKGVLYKLQNDQPDLMAGYHPKIHRVLADINRERGWRQKPVGPLGQYMQLLKPEWSSIIERTFGGSLGGFLVTNKPDQDRINAICNKHGYNSTNAVVTTRPIDTSRNEPGPQLDTVLRVLQFDNDLVRNQLIIHPGIDQIVLMKELNDAMAFARTHPQNVKWCLSMQKDPRGGIRVAPNRTDPMDPWPKAVRIRTDIGAQVEQQQQAVTFIGREIQPMENALREFENQLKQCKQALVRFDTEAKDAVLRVTRGEQRIAELKDALELAKPQDGKLDSLKEHLREAEELVTHLQGQYNAASEARVPLLAEYQQLKQAVDATDAQLTQHGKKVERIEGIIRKAREKRDDSLQLKNDADNSLRDAKDEKEQQAEVLKDAKDTVKTYITEATKYCARVRVGAGETCKSLEERLTKLDKQQKDSERRLGGNMNDLKLRAAETEIIYNRASDQLDHAEELRDTLNTTLGERKRRWKIFRQLITARARTTFTYLLSERAFRGSMTIDHKNKLLELRVEPDITVARNDGTGRTTKTLSGGEKSFSTICMLLSMWDAMGSPIRCLDEFDVFMDSVNRDISMRMMIGAAMRAVGRQFILISPQAMGNVALDKHVKVHKMTDPERGQRAIGQGMSVV